VEPLALAGLVGLLLVKEAGLPVPVPGDLLVIGAGAALAADGPGAIGGLALILGAGYLGGTIQFALLRGAVRRPLLRALERLGVGAARLEALGARLRSTGARGVAVSRMTPGVRVASIAACGLAGLPLDVFAFGLVIGNTVFVTAHFALGFVLGASAPQVLGQLGGSLLPALLAIAVLAAIGAFGWWLLRRSAADQSTSTHLDWRGPTPPARHASPSSSWSRGRAADGRSRPRSVGGLAEPVDGREASPPRRRQAQPDESVDRHPAHVHAGELGRRPGRLVEPRVQCSDCRLRLVEPAFEAAPIAREEHGLDHGR
jgi:membrane protein DedA with SNARE-associated domain